MRIRRFASCQQLRPQNVQDLFHSFNPIEVCWHGKSDPPVFGELPVVQPNYPVTSNTQEAKTCNHALLAGYVNYVRLQQIQRLNVDAKFLENLPLDGVAEAFAIVNSTSAALPFPGIEVAIICPLCNEHFPVIVCRSDANTRNVHFEPNMPIFPDWERTPVL